MRFSLITVLSLVGAGMVSARPSEGSVVAKRDSSETKVQEANAALAGKKYENESEVSECIAPLLCCSSLTTPLDHIVDPILKELGVDAAKIVGSIGLLCKWLSGLHLDFWRYADGFTSGDPYAPSTCDSAPQCCTEANLLVSLLHRNR